MNRYRAALSTVSRRLQSTLVMCLSVCIFSANAFGASENTESDLATASSLPIIKVGVLKFGTINWEMDTIIHHQLDIQRGFRLEVHPFASKNASAVALQSGAVDVIMTDLFWVSRQRGRQKPYVIMPTTKASGGVYTHPNMPFQELMRRNDVSIGVAGGSVDKNWLLLQAYSKKQNLNLLTHATPKFAAPPLINRFMLSQELDASINFWHYNARLAAAGLELTLPVTTMLTNLNVQADVPLLGWVFDETWANQQTSLITGFIKASFAAKFILANQPQEWLRIRSLTKAESDEVFESLQINYPTTLLTQFSHQEIAATQQLFRIFADVGGQELMGSTSHFDPNIYWVEALRLWQAQ